MTGLRNGFLIHGIQKGVAGIYQACSLLAIACQATFPKHIPSTGPRGNFSLDTAFRVSPRPLANG
jgi:hypothetical protein